MKKNLFLFMYLFIFSLRAENCLSFKTNVNTNILSPIWTKEVVFPLNEMNFLHGNVIATLENSYEILINTSVIEEGFCVSLKEVNLTIGYNNFLVQIDKRHKDNECTYNAVLSHEDEHIKTYLKIIEDYNKEIKKTLSISANSIMPIFVEKEKDIEKTIDIFYKKLEKHPEIILLKRKIKIEEELRNKKIDEVHTEKELNKCLK